MLTDFDAYPDWNPFIRSIAGSLVEGEVLQVSLGLLTTEHRQRVSPWFPR